LRGKVTATNEGITAVFDALQKAGEALKLRFKENGRSGQLVNYRIVSVKIDDVFQDIIICRVDLELPHMANRIELYLQVVSENSALNTVLSSPSTSLAV